MANSDQKNKPPTLERTRLGCRQYGWVVIVIVALLIGQSLYNGYITSQQEITWTEFQRDMLNENAVAKIVIINNETAEVYIRPDRLGSGTFEEIEPGSAGPHYVFTIGSLDHFEQVIQSAQEQLAADQKIDLQFVKRENWWANILPWVLPLLIIVGLWFLLLGRMGRGAPGAGNIFDFGKSSAKPFEKGKSSVTFDDVAGMDEVKVEVREIVDFLKRPERFTNLGGKIPKGVILIGPPGTGKTLLAKAVAGEADVPFFSMSGSEFVEMFVGVGASRVRDLFEKAKKNAPSIIFIDEIDAIGRSRGRAASFQANDERESTLNQLLSEMDGFEPNTGIIVLAATNRGEILDKALLRPGRFDRHIYINLPTQLERKAIFEVHTKPLKLAPDVNLDTMAAQSPGFSGADIANICNEAALIAARKEKESVEMEDFMDATDKVIAGLERKSQIISPREKKIIAYHEAGHATVSWYLPYADTLLKVSIIPRGKALGATWFLPEEHAIVTKPEFLDRIAATLGGRAAEQVVFDQISSNALDDLEKVTKQAYTMVAYYGLNEELGNLSFYDSTGSYEQMFGKPYSEATAEKIDAEVKKIVDREYQRAKDLLSTHRDELDMLAHRLIEKETVYKEDLSEIFGERPQVEGSD